VPRQDFAALTIGVGPLCHPPARDIARINERTNSTSNALFSIRCALFPITLSAYTMFPTLYPLLVFASAQSTNLFSYTTALLDKNTRVGGGKAIPSPNFMKHFISRRKTAPCPLESALTRNLPLTLLQSILTKTLDLKSFRINTYRNTGGRGCLHRIFFIERPSLYLACGGVTLRRNTSGRRRRSPEEAR
jgi:hypothetical protein